jgi:hypothetical protein
MLQDFAEATESPLKRIGKFRQRSAAEQSTGGSVCAGGAVFRLYSDFNERSEAINARTNSVRIWKEFRSKRSGSPAPLSLMNSTS